MFNDPLRKKKAEDALEKLVQGHGPYLTYLTCFQALACDSNWGNEALMHRFYSGLHNKIKDQLLSSPEPTELTELMKQASTADNRLVRQFGDEYFKDTQAKPQLQQNSTVFSKPSEATDDPMIIHAAGKRCLSPAERQC